jgi:hypothetical protein
VLRDRQELQVENSAKALYNGTFQVLLNHGTVDTGHVLKFAVQVQTLRNLQECAYIILETWPK